MAAGMLKPFPHKLPIVLGHEIAGVIAAAGGGVTDYTVGDRVGLFQLVDGHGDTRDGGFAQRTVATVEALVPIPGATSYAQAAVGTDAGMTSYHAVISAGGVRQGTKLGIIGLVVWARSVPASASSREQPFTAPIPSRSLGNVATMRGSPRPLKMYPNSTASTSTSSQTSLVSGPRLPARSK
jgi:D-arabinose 1-dehydrogenase-like Zn-dependent alcohol dehydrogenase